MGRIRRNFGHLTKTFYRVRGDYRMVSLYIYIDNKHMTDAAPDYTSEQKPPVQSTDSFNLASSSQYTPSRLESQTYQNLSSDSSSFNVAQNSALFNRNLYASASFSDLGAYNRAFSQRQNTAKLPEITLASADLNPNTSMSRINDVQNNKYDAVLPQVSFTSDAYSNANAGSLDKLSRGALDYIKNNNDQLRRSNARGPFEGNNAAAYLPNVSFGPSSSAYTFETPTNWQQQQQNAFNGCPCSACANSNYRPENGTRPYQVQPWNQPQGYNPNPGYVPPNAPAGYGDPQFNDPRFADPRFDQPGQFFPGQTDQYFNNSNRVTPDLMPPGWFEEIYGNGPAPRPRPSDNPNQPYRPTRPTGGDRYPQGTINRSQFDSQLADPNVMAAFAGRMKTEVGSQGADAQLAWAETVMNRAASRGITLLQALTGRYYPTHNPGRSDNPAFIQAITKAWQEGTDTTKGSTGNASGSVGFGRTGREIIRINGEKFGMEEVDLNKGWMQKYQQLKFGDRGANPNNRPERPTQPGYDNPVANPTTADQITPQSAKRYPGLIPEADRQNLMRMALIKCGLPVNDAYIKGLTIIIQKESSWDPNVVNRWDSNWRRGTPSMGLIQTIEPTFKTNKMEGFDDILNPLHNMIAGIRYAVKRYGDLLNVPGLRSMRNGGAYKGY
ncbi:transglycosylase SLT domain-containing protein [bacterium]|nr:transglycosylase SLT domain-containing protein [bacterium]QQR56206.1 MAG: transglycosylase SLT domain-containing protein [Candidatus Melainabacteria bacterium]